METKNYPGVSDRVKAVMGDTVIIILFMFVITYLFSLLDNVSDQTRGIAFLFTFLLYDPLFTSIFGGTLGHMMFGIRVKRESNESKNILFPLALLRYLIKITLGWISLLTITGNEKRKAVHDYLARSVVVYK